MKDLKKENIYYVAMTDDDINPFKDDKFNPFRSDENEHKKLCYILYKDINYVTTDSSRKKIVLYNDTKEMFVSASNLAK